MLQVRRIKALLPVYSAIRSKQKGGEKAMVIVKNGLKGLNPAKKVTFGTKLGLKLTGNAFFPGAALFNAAMGTATGDLNTAIQDPHGTTATIKEKTQAFNRKEKAVIGYVQGVVNEVSDALALEMLSTLGLDSKIVVPIHIGDYTAKQGTEAQSISVRKKGEKKRVTYRTQICTDPSLEENWKDVKISSKAKCIIKDLLSKTEYFLRVAIIRGDIQEDWSDYISIIVD